MTDIVIASFYQFAWLPDYEILQQRLLAFCRHLEVKGTILLAREGINGTIAGSRMAVESVLDYLRADPSLVEHLNLDLDRAARPNPESLQSGQRRHPEITQEPDRPFQRGT